MRIGIGHIHGLGQAACSGPLDPLCGEAAPSSPSDAFNPSDPTYAAQSASSLSAQPLTTTQLAFLTNPSPGSTTQPTSSPTSTGTILAIAAVAILGFAMVAKR
jgi:hypothetical protein